MRVQILKRRGLILIQKIEYSAQTTLELEIASRDPCLNLQWSIYVLPESIQWGLQGRLQHRPCPLLGGRSYPRVSTSIRKTICAHVVAKKMR